LEAVEEFLEKLDCLIAKWHIDTLIPVTEATLLAVLGNRSRLGGVLIPFPELDRFRRISDKRAVLSAAEGLGIHVPRQVVLSEPGSVHELLQEGGDFPLVIKPARSVVPTGRGALKVGVSYAAGPAELRSRVDSYPATAFPLLLQRRISGPGIGIFLLMWKGEQVAVFAHRRLREKPPSGGVSVYRESIAAPPDLVAMSRALLDVFGWEGVAMIEYKVDAATGTPYLMEVNGRFWGSLQLAIDAGVDFPVLLVEAAHGGQPAPVTEYRLGVRSRWWWGDVDHLLARLRHPDEVQEWPGEPRSRARAVLDFFKLWRPGDRSEVLRWDDPKPFLVETLDWIAAR